MTHRGDILGKTVSSILIGAIVLGGKILYGQYSAPIEKGGLQVYASQTQNGFLSKNPKNILAIHMKDGSDKPGYDVGDAMDSKPSGILISDPNRNWLFITAGSSELAPRRLEIQVKLDPTKDDPVVSAEAVLYSFRGACPTAQNLQMTSVELQNDGCVLEATKSVSGKIVIDELKLKGDVADIQGRMILADFNDATLGRVNFGFNLSAKRWVPAKRASWTEPPVVRLDPDQSASKDDEVIIKNNPSETAEVSIQEAEKTASELSKN